MIKKSILLICATLLILSSCKLKPGDGLSWDADYLLPIAKTRLNIKNSLEDSSLLKPGTDLVTLVFRDSMAVANIVDLVELPDTSLRFPVNLDTLALALGVIERKITLGEMGRQLKAQGNALGDFLLNNHGNTLPFPGLKGFSTGTVPIDGSGFFDEAEIESGFMRVTIENGLPVDIDSAEFQIQNVSGPPPFISDLFEKIRSRQTESRLYDVSGKTIESALEGALANMNLGLGFITIDTTDFISITMEPVNLKIRKATAVFPGQSIIDTVQETKYVLGSGFEDVQLTKAVIESGRIRARSVSTIADTIQFAYSLPLADRNGENPSVAFKLNPAVGGVASEQTQTADLGGFTLDLRGADGTSFNTLLQQYRVDLLYSGNKVTIGLDDSLEVFFGLEDLKPTYVEGYIGKHKFRFKGQQAIDIFEHVDIQKLAFAQPKGRLSILNSIGVDSRVLLRDVRARNSQTGEEVRLAGAVTRSRAIDVDGISLPDTFGAAFTPLEFNATDGNLDDFVNLLPDELIYDVEVDANYNGTPGVYTNFATNKSELAVYVEFELPLEGLAERFRMTDTTKVSFDISTLEKIEKINGGTIKLLIDNQFPFEAAGSAKMMDVDGKAITQLASDFSITAGLLDSDGSGRTETVRTVWEKTFSKELMQQIIKEGDQVSFDILMNTRPDGKMVKIYTDYFVDLKLVVEFNYSH